MTTLSQEIVFSAINEVNEDSDGAAIIVKSPSTTLLGSDSLVDSLSLVRLLVTIERLVEEQTGKNIVIVDESAFEEERSPFATVQSLIFHLESLISK